MERRGPVPRQARFPADQQGCGAGGGIWATACGGRGKDRSVDSKSAGTGARNHGHHQIVREISGDRVGAQNCRNFGGSWDGLTHVDIDAQWPGRLDQTTPFNWFFRSPDGESYDAAMARVNPWLDNLQGIVLAVSHGLIGRLIRGAYLGLSREDALGLPVPQDVIWRLAKGAVEPIHLD